MRIAEEADSLHAVVDLGLTHLRRAGPRPHPPVANQDIVYALAGRADEALRLVAGALEEFHSNFTAGGRSRAGPRAPHHGDGEVPRNGHGLLAGAGRG